MVDVLTKKTTIIYIFCFSLLFKLMILILLDVKIFPDSSWYVSIAEKIWNQSLVFPNNEIKDAPGTPYFYAFLYPLTKVFGLNTFALGNIFVATLTVVLSYKISLEIFEDLKAANVTALIFAIYPFFNFYSITILTETIYIFFLYLSFLYAIRFIKTFQLKDSVLFSFFFAIDTLIRFANLPMFIFFIFLFIIVLKMNQRPYNEVLKTVLVGISVFILTMTPWWIRNYNVHGEFVATSIGESGKVFYSGNNPMNKSGGGIGHVDVDLRIFNNIKDPSLKDAAMWKAGIEWIKNNPSDWAALEFRKLKRLYSPLFYAKNYNTLYYNLISILSYGVIFLLFLYGLFKFKSKFWLYSPMFLYAMLLTGVHLVFIASIRYRLPIEPFMIILATPIIVKFINKYEKSS